MTFAVQTSVQSRRAAQSTRPSARQLTVVIPAFNEGEAIGLVVASLLEKLPGAHILVIDDGSSDDTARVAEEAGATVIRHKRNRGYGAALKTGIRACRTPFVSTFDADGQHNADDVLRMLEHIGHADAVIGNRQSDSYRPVSRRPGKWVLAKVANALVGQTIPDLNCGLRMFRRNAIARYLHLLPNGFSASTTSTVCLLQRGYNVNFMPIRTGKRVGKSTVRQLRDGWNTVVLIVRLIVLFNPLRFFTPPAIGLVLVGMAYGLLRAWYSGLGIPVLSALLVIAGILTVFFGLLADQLSSLRKEMFERDDQSLRTE
jgi:glycosyltransferase involved in cell wall biosynthesis